MSSNYLDVYLFRLQRHTNMCKLKNCCGCVKLRTGCIIIAIVEFSLVLANLSITAIPLPLRYHVGWFVRTWALVLGVILGLIVWILLLFGALANNSILVLINLVGVLLSIVGRAFVFILLTVNFADLLCRVLDINLQIFNEIEQAFEINS